MNETKQTNPDNLQIMITRSNRNIDDNYPLKTGNIEISSTDSVNLLGIEIDKLNFEKDISILCRKASNQLNAIARIQHYLETKERLRGPLFLILITVF